MHRDEHRAIAEGVDVHWTHDGLTVQQRGRTRYSWLFLTILGLVVVTRLGLESDPSWFDLELDSVLLVLLGPLLVITGVSMLPRRIEIRGDWLILTGAGQAKIRLEEVEEVRTTWGTSRFVFQLRDGRLHTLWLGRAFQDAARRWLLDVVRDAVSRARVKEATRDTADSSSRRALGALRNEVTTRFTRTSER